MTERLPCKNPDCTNTILPSTAERTGGFCMPCVQVAEKKERDEYVQKNRRDVNEFDGITDPVEVLEIIHTPRNYDPLVNWIPYATPEDQLYTELSRHDQLRLAKYAESLIGSEQNDEAESIVLCLAAFTDAPLENCLRAFANHNSYWPSLPFCRAPSDVRDELIARIELDEDNRNHILCALAWIGDDSVVELFNTWRALPPSWSDSLYMPPQDYSRVAGWELDENGQRRDLFFHSCTKLVRGHSDSPGPFKTITKRDDLCPWCGSYLINLIELEPSEFNIDYTCQSTIRIQVTTCEVCTLFGVVFSMFDDNGHGEWSSLNSKPDYLPDDSEGWDQLPSNTLTPAGKRATQFAADQFLPTTFSQIGGLPAWIQDDCYPQCPSCSKTMLFLAQLDHDDIEDHSEGMYYAFLCPDCKMTATTYQQT